MYRAILFLLLVVLCLVWLTVAAPLLFLHLLVCTFMSLSNSRWQDYGTQVFVAWDQLFNVLAAPLLRLIFEYPEFDFGYADETISSVVGKNIKMGRRKYRGLETIDRWLSRVDPRPGSHSKEAIETDEGDK